MNEKAYAKAVARRLACSKARRGEFVRDLESDIASSLADGETWEQVERRLGDPRDVAREFNEALSERELAAGRKRQRLRTAGIAAAAAVVVVAVLAAGSWWALPKTAPAGQGIGLTEQEILGRAQEVVALVDAEDFDALRSMSTEPMQNALDATSLEAARASFSDDLGGVRGVRQRVCLRGPPTVGHAGGRRDGGHLREHHGHVRHRLRERYEALQLLH